MTEVEDPVGISSEKFLQSDIPGQSRSMRKVYARDYLLSFANLKICQLKPDNIDPGIWRELQTADIANGAVATSGNFSRGSDRKERESETHIKSLRDIPEWRRNSIHPGSVAIQQSSRRKPFDDEAPGSQFSNSYSSKQASQWGENTQSRNSHGRQAIQSSGSITGHGKWGHRGDRERDRSRFHLNRDSDESDSGHSNVGSPSVRLGWNMAEHDGLLGSGESVRGSFAGHALKPLEKFASSGHGGPSRTSNETFHSQKASFAPRRQGTDSMNDETFGAEEQSTDEKLEQERKRRESFELMRREYKRPQGEKHDVELKMPEDQTVAKMEETADKMHVRVSKWDDVQGEHMSAPKTPALMSVPSASRLLVPPGFSHDSLPMMMERKSSNIEECTEKMEDLKNGGDNPEQREADHTSVIADNEEFLSSHLNIKKSEEEISQISTVDSGEQPRHTVENILNQANPELKRVIEMPGTFFMIEGGNSGDASPKMSKFAKWFHTEDENTSQSVSGGDAMSKILSLFPKSMNSDTTPNEVPCKILKDDECHDDNMGSPSAFHLPRGNPAQVLPMPVGPSLEDIEKDLTLANDKKDDQLSSTSYRDSNDGLFSKSGGYGRIDTSHLVSLPDLLPCSPELPKVFLTCEDIEQSLLAETRGHDEQLSSVLGISQSTSNSSVSKDDKSPNHVASQYLLSLLHKGAMVNSTRDEGFRDQQGAKDELQSTYLPFLEQESHLQNKDTNSVPTLEALFGKAFMKELRSIEAPVSVQSLPNEPNELYGVDMPNAHTEHTVYSDPLSNAKPRITPLTSMQRYNPNKVEMGSHSTLPTQKYKMHDEQDYHHTDYLLASQLPPLEGSSLLDILAGRPSRSSSSGNPFPLSRTSSAESLERSMPERTETGGRNKPFVETILNGVPNGGQVYGLTERGTLQEISAISRIDGQPDGKIYGLSLRVTDAIQQSNQDPVIFKPHSIGRVGSLLKDMDMDVENKLGFDPGNVTSANSPSTRVSSTKLQSQSSLPAKSLYRSHSPVSTFSAGLNISLDHLQQALVSNDLNPSHPSQKQMGPQFVYSPLDQLPMHHTNSVSKMDFSYSGLRHQQEPAFARSRPHTAVTGQPHPQHLLPESFLNPHGSFPRAVLGGNFSGGQFPHQGFSPSVNMHSFVHEQPPYDSQNFLAKGTHGYSPLDGPFNHPIVNTNLPFPNLDFQHGLHVEHPLHAHLQPNANWRPSDLNHRFPRMPPHWN